MSATWVFRPATLNELVSRAPAAVVAEVTSVQSGPPLAADSKFHPQETVPTQRIGFRAKDVWYGNVPVTFKLFKTGSGEFSIQGDPPYEVGERYVLFVRTWMNGAGEREVDTYVPLSPDGRLKIRDGGRLEPQIDGKLGSRLRGAHVEELKSQAQAGKAALR